MGNTDQETDAEFKSVKKFVKNWQRIIPVNTGDDEKEEDGETSNDSGIEINVSGTTTH